MNLKREFLAFATGCTTVVAFAPFNLFPLAIICLAILFRTWRDLTPKQAARVGFSFGFGFFLVGIHWVYISVNVFGQTSAFIAVVVLLVLVSLQAFFFALVGALQALATNLHYARYLLLIPSLWVLMEWTRGWFLTGFPWLYVGYSQIDSWLAGWAPYYGVLGVSFAACISAGALSLVKLQKDRIQKNTIMLLVASMPWIFGYMGNTLDWVKDQDSSLNVAMIQADVSIESKFNRQSAQRTLEFFLEKSNEAYESDLIIWPETALAYASEHLEDSKFWDFLKSHPADFLIGILDYSQESFDKAAYNSVFGVSEEIQVYRKTHLVPFGEYVPARWLFEMLGDLVSLPDDFTSFTDAQKPIEVAGYKAGVSICFEDAFPSEVLKMLPDASFLVNLSEDVWFGRFVAPDQQLQMSRMRAKESGRPMLRVANKGLSASVDSKGRIIDSLRQEDGTLLRTTIVPTHGETPYVAGGHRLILPICLIAIWLCFMIARRYSRKAG